MTSGYTHIWSNIHLDRPKPRLTHHIAQISPLLRLSLLTAASITLSSLVNGALVQAQTDQPPGFTKESTNPAPPSSQSSQGYGNPAPPNLPTAQPARGNRSAIALALAGGGTLVGTLIWRRHRHQQLNQQLTALKNRTANIMTLCDDLLTGSVPTQTVHYQLFTAAGGEKYPELTKQFKTLLNQARQSLDQAFVIRNRLEQQLPKRLKALAQHVGDWELLYLSLVGDSQDIQTLNESQLRSRLDPILNFPEQHNHEDNISTTAETPLQTLQQKIEQTSSTIKFLIIKPDAAAQDAPNIVDHIDQTNHHIRKLKASAQSAPLQLMEVKQQRQDLEAQIPHQFGISTEQLLSSIDHSVKMATEALDNQLFLYTLDHCQTAAQSMGYLKNMVTALELLHQRQENIDAILKKGYHPSELTTHTKTIQACLDQLHQYIQDNNYTAIARQSEVLNQLTQASLAHVQAWENQHLQNQTAIENFAQRLSHLRSQDQNQAEPAWQALKTYPEDNWKMVETSLPNARQLIDQAEKEALPQIKALNSLEQQALNKAQYHLQQAQEQLLTTAATHLDRVCQQAQKVQALETNLSTMLVRSEETITHVDNLIRPKALGLLQLQKIDPRLANAQERIAQAHQSVQSKNFMTALATHNEANRAILIAYRDKVQADLNRVQALYKHQYARGTNRHALNQATEQLNQLNTLDTLDETNIEQHFQILEKIRNETDAAEKMVKATIRRRRSRGY